MMRQRNIKYNFSFKFVIDPKFKVNGFKVVRRYQNK